MNHSAKYETTVQILGCGSSAGVPRLGVGWDQCDSNESKNRRQRCSLLIVRRTGEAQTSVLIDTSPDFRAQFLTINQHQLDAVVYTHSHADHTHGIDDLRSLVQHQKHQIPLYGDRSTMENLQHQFGYIFKQKEGSCYPAIATAHTITPPADLEISGAGGTITLNLVPVQHGRIESMSIRVNGIVYTPDVSGIPEPVADHFQHMDCWIVDALRDAPHSTHFSTSDALLWIARLKPKQAILTNLSAELDYGILRRKLPDHVSPAWDGRVIRA